jgi:hypothetical protein
MVELELDLNLVVGKKRPKRSKERYEQRVPSHTRVVPNQNGPGMKKKI